MAPGQESNSDNLGFFFFFFFFFFLLHNNCMLSVPIRIAIEVNTTHNFMINKKNH